MTTNPTTELEAVNSILAVIGESPVNTLVAPLPPSASAAYDTLTEINREVQMEGWAFNTEREYELLRDVSNEIHLPVNTLRVDIDHARTGSAQPTQRGMRLYDRKGHTYVFTANQWAKKLLVCLEFTELPEAARRYILIRAARIFQQRTAPGQEIQFTAEDERSARRLMVADHSEATDLNMLTSPGVFDIVRRP